MGNYHVRFLGGKGAAMPPTYPILLFPSRGDDNLVKFCEGKGNETTYELRSKAMGGMRVYFFSNNDTIIIASLHTKAQSVGTEQTSDIKNASAIIKKIKIKNNIK